ncbi:hypothetical protein ACCO45_013535 [Purpureocillium lilacinum]|uniref:Uncharacterized protein n=1 Tax=Purpureocillium lilacinum TaxID=33203 RepID=A0ACC4D986_PURLI
MAHFDAPAHRAAARVRAIDKAPPPAAQTTGLLQCKPDLEVCRCRGALPDAVHSLCPPQSCSAHMSAKRRKVDAPGTQARRLASAEPSPSPATPPSNPFSPLLQRREATASPKRLARTPNQGQDARPESKATQTYSSFRLTASNHRIRAGVTELKLEDSERFLVLGSFGLRVLAGEVTVAGATLRPGETTYWVHAPHCHAVPVLRTAEKTRLEIHGDPNADGLRRLGRLSPCFAASGTRTSPSAPFSLRTAEVRHPAAGLSPKWNRKLLSLVEAAARAPSATLVCGPKAAGKSTFSRLLTNRLLTSAGGTKGVVVLDLDPGQPEYAPPGTLSLVHVAAPNLGAPFTHPSLDDGAYRVLRCHSLASVNPAAPWTSTTSTGARTATAPLIVNTPGWVLSLGLELLVQIITNIRPEVVYMSEEGPVETVDALTEAARDGFTALPSQPAEFASRTAAHFRDMQAMSYFHSVPGGPRLSWTPSALSAARPLVVHYARGAIRGILRYDYQLQADLLAEAINGAILAVVEVESPEALRGLPDARPTPEGLPFIPNPNDVALDPRHSRTIGLALVRGVDAAQKTLQVLTPMPVQRIADARAHGHDVVLVHGKFDAPTWAYTEHLHEQDTGEAVAELEVTDEDTSDDSSEEADMSADVEGAVPWVEVLQGNQKRPVGSRVWRVRRDLGRGD